MKQILQNLSSGETELAEIPAPQVRPGTILIRSEASLVSLGTEKMLIDLKRIAERRRLWEGFSGANDLWTEH